MKNLKRNVVSKLLCFSREKISSIKRRKWWTESTIKMRRRRKIWSIDWQISKSIVESRKTEDWTIRLIHNRLKFKNYRVKIVSKIVGLMKYSERLKLFTARYLKIVNSLLKFVFSLKLDDIKQRFLKAI